MTESEQCALHTLQHVFRCLIGLVLFPILEQHLAKGDRNLERTQVRFIAITFTDLSTKRFSSRSF